MPKIGNKTIADLQDLEVVAQRTAQMIGPLFEQYGACFCVLGFTIGDGGWSTWVSNADRACMIEALREMADKLEAGLDMPPIRTGEPEAG